MINYLQSDQIVGRHKPSPKVSEKWAAFCGAQRNSLSKQLSCGHLGTILLYNHHHYHSDIVVTVFYVFSNLRTWTNPGWKFSWRHRMPRSYLSHFQKPCASAWRTQSQTPSDFSIFSSLSHLPELNVRWVRLLFPFRSLNLTLWEEEVEAIHTSTRSTPSTLNRTTDMNMIWDDVGMGNFGGPAFPTLATCSPPMFLWHFSASHRGVKLKDAISTSIDPSNPFPSNQTPTRNQSLVGETYVHLLIIRVQQLFDIRMGLVIHLTRNIYWILLDPIRSVILLDPIGLFRFATPNYHVPWCTKNLM